MADFNRQRSVVFGCALLVTAGNLLMRFNPPANPRAPALTALGAVLLWIIVFRLSSFCNTLALLDQSDKARDGKPAV